MLKIKDNVDLKELEKYGFIKKSNLLYVPNTNDKTRVIIRVVQETRELKASGLFAYEIGIDILYDLINDGLVEKVKDE